MLEEALGSHAEGLYLVRDYLLHKEGRLQRLVQDGKEVEKLFGVGISVIKYLEVVLRDGEAQRREHCLELLQVRKTESVVSVELDKEFEQIYLFELRLVGYQLVVSPFIEGFGHLGLSEDLLEAGAAEANVSAEVLVVVLNPVSLGEQHRREVGSAHQLFDREAALASLRLLHHRLQIHRARDVLLGQDVFELAQRDQAVLVQVEGLERLEDLFIGELRGYARQELVELLEVQRTVLLLVEDLKDTVQAALVGLSELLGLQDDA